jgi:hypothetical protein
MDTNSPPQAVYYVYDALLCITFLVGIVAGVIALTRKKALLGILAIAAFLFYGIEIVIRYIIWYGLYDVIDNYGVLEWASFCLTTPLILLGSIALVVIVFITTGKKHTLPPPPDSNENPPAA